MIMKDHYRVAPHHSHYFGLPSSITLGHSHSLKAFVFPVNGSSTDRHVHTFKGISSTENEHLHHLLEGKTGPAITLPDGSHYHEIFGKTGNRPFIHQGNFEIPVSYPVHDHEYKGVTGIGIGYEPTWW